MIKMDINNFIAKHITKRDESLLISDLMQNNHLLKSRISRKKVFEYLILFQYF